MMSLLEKRSSMRSALASAVVCLSLGASALAQTNWSMDGTSVLAGEYNSPPAICTVAPPPYAVMPVPPVPGCLPLSPFGFCAGGIAVDNNGNALSGGTAYPALVASDGNVILMTRTDGTPIASWFVAASLPGFFVAGLAYDSAGDVIWVTDGIYVAALGLAPGCGVMPVLVPPFALGVVAPVCGIAWDPCSGTLWTIEPGLGEVEHWRVTGAPLGFFSVSPPLSIWLSGIAVNVTNGNIQVSDDTSVAEFTPGGVLAAPGAFYLTSNPFPIPAWGASVYRGLGFSLRPQNFGLGFSPIGPAPRIHSGGGYAFAGNATFTISETGAAGGATSLLLYGIKRACPPLPVAGCPPGTGLFLAAGFSKISTGIVPATGTVTLGAPLPSASGCGIPVGIPLFMQFVNFGGPLLPPGKVELTDALSFTIGAL
jgi:hypothetical protein